MAGSEISPACFIGNGARVDVTLNSKAAIRAKGSTFPSTLFLFIAKDGANAFNNRITVAWVATVPLGFAASHCEALARSAVAVIFAILVADAIRSVVAGSFFPLACTEEVTRLGIK